MVPPMTAEALVLDSPASLPEVPRHAAPWRLQGSAYAVLVRLTADADDDPWFVPPSLRGKRDSRLAILLLVDYAHSECGPYRELMALGAGFDFGGESRPSITRIYVSTFESVVNGRANWGIPKDRADFAVERTAAHAERITVSRDGRTVARLDLQGFGLALPVTGAMLPPSWRTITQHWHGQEYRIALAAKGKARLARVVDWSFDPELFPDFAGTRVLAAAHLPSFEMTFPVAQVRPIA
jgi:Acetoacetate decarboxylase (ADC)